MEFLVILVGFIALLMAMSARKGVASLQLQLNGVLARLSRLQDELEDLRRQRPSAAAPEAPAPTSQVPAVPAPATPALPSEAVTPTPEPPPVVAPPSAAEAAAPAPTPTPAPTGTTLEERLGTRWAVWAGGLLLALGGLLLVRFSIEQGIFGPGVRIALAALFSLALVAAGEWFRRNERASPVEAIPAAHVPSILTAAGTVSAFGTVYAAHALYEFIGPAAAFVLLGIIGVATMLAAALHGPALAGLGLAGSLVVPLLVSSQTPSPWPLVIYLAVVAGAAYALARFRRWLWLASAVVVGVFFWGLALLGQIDAGIAGDWASALFVHTGLQLALAAAFMALEPHLATPDEEAAPDWVATAALAALSVLAVLALGAGRFDTQWTVFAIAAMAILALTSWRSAPAAAAAVLAGVVSLGAIAAWPGLTADPEPRLLAPAMAEVLRVPDNVSRFMIFTISVLPRHRPAGDAAPGARPRAARRPPPASTRWPPSCPRCWR